MGIELKKGANINLLKEEPNLKNLKIGLGWDISKFNSNGNFDLDVSIFCLEKDEKGSLLKKERDFIFYGNLSNEDNSVIHTGDNRTGDGDGDDESIEIKLNKIEERIQELSIIVSIYDAVNKKQNFGMVDNAYIALYNIDTNNVIARYDLTEEFSTETSVQFGSIYKYNDEWKFKAVGSGYNAGLDAFIKEYRAGHFLV